MIIVHVLLCAGLVWLGYWRVVKANKETHRSVRISLCLLTTACLAMALSPFAWGQPITGVILFFEGCLLLHQATTTKLWTAGPPPALQRDTIP